MRKAVLFLIALLAAAGFAQNTPSQETPTAPPAARRHRPAGPGANIDRRVAALTRRFNLTDEQQQKLRPILEQELQQARSIRQDTSLAPADKRQKFVALHKQTQEQIQGLLTPEQQAMQKERRQAARGDRALGWLNRKVNLTDEQKTKLQPIFADQQQQVQAVRQDTSLSPEQKNQKIRAIRQQTHKQILGVLTPEQRQQLRARPKPNTPTGPGTGK